MTDIWLEKDEYGQDVIYVNSCEKFEYEKQKDLPNLNKKYEREKKVYITSGHLLDKEQYDKIK